MTTVLVLFFAGLALVGIVNFLFAKDDLKFQKEINKIYLNHKVLSDKKLGELHEENNKLKKLCEEYKAELRILTGEQTNQ